MRALVVCFATGCVFDPQASPPAGPSPDAGMMGPSAIEWLGDVGLHRDGFALPADKILAGAPLDVCVDSYPKGAAARARLVWSGGEAAMAIAAEGTGPFAHNTRWCGQLPALAAGDTALAIIAEDPAGAALRVDTTITARTEIALFAGAADAALWRMAGRGTFSVDGDTLHAHPGTDLGLYWAAVPTPADFELSLEWAIDRTDDNSGVFVRFRDPTTFGYDNPAWVGVHDGLEIQIDDTARPDGADVHRTGAVYEQPGSYARPAASAPGVFRPFVIRVTGMRIVVTLDGAQVSDVTFAGDPQHPDRARPSAANAPRFLGLQTHSGVVAFRNVLLKAL